MASTNIKVTHADTGLVTAEVLRAEQISPHFVRITLGGEDLHRWRSLGFDQWFRLALPISAETRFDRLSDRFDMRGYLRYLALPKASRPVIRSYTVREYRPEAGELDVDFVVHGTEGVAGPWAASLPTGAPVALIDQGCGYRPVENANRVLLAGDESALPATLGILRDLPDETTGTAIIEVPHEADQQPVISPAGINMHWIVRDTNARPGAEALAALRELPLDGDAPVSAFLAGEQQLATGGRRHLAGERGIPKTSIDFTGYWRHA
ncbi:probable siderophore interacting protein [Microbacterium esteraromaticum]|uniref:Probable siderophore interacting protein n=1 Tax=Microbacterium esteraromaticum TaxID=57043 RepID=A0A1R4KNI7_9MICO|nr:siderophore-interacting protein [Microbacterium esteraromaticum]SJN45697.1 probable siderophore interacting protein [Microbacterium esteraromaticum]